MARILLIAGSLRCLALVGALGVVALVTASCGAAVDAPGNETTTTVLSAEAVTLSLQANLTIPDSTCLGCHADFSALLPLENRKSFSHALHLGERVPCLTCHAGAGHAGAMAPADSLVCADCHGISMPHPVNFLASHGRLVDQQGPSVCIRCHNTKLYCEQCHGLPMPHPEGWDKTHGSSGATQPQICLDCHTPKTCGRCHGPDVPHPAGWLGAHGAASLAGDASKGCTTCHAPGYCTDCHGTPMPHGVDWGRAHASAAAAGDGACLVCHARTDCDACHTLHKTHGKGGGS